MRHYLNFCLNNTFLLLKRSFAVLLTLVLLAITLNVDFRGFKDGLAAAQLIPIPSEPTRKDAPRTGQEQFIVKVKQEAFRGRSPGTTDEDIMHALGSKHAKIKKVKKGLGRTAAMLANRNDSHAPRVENLFSLEVEKDQPLVQALERLRADPLIEYAQWNYLYEPDAIPNDPQYGQQWAHPITEAPAAWDLTTGSSGVVIAVIGTGVKWDHADLAANIWMNADEIAANGIDDDGNGFIDDIRGWNFEFDNNNPTGIDGHETSVAGVAAAIGNNGVGITGVCWQCKIMPLRISYTTIDVTDALYYAINNGAKIVNMSFGDYDPGEYGPDATVEIAVDFGVSNGVMIIATAGNNSINTRRYPGALENVIGVAATDASDNRAGFSNWGDWVDIAAPGSSVLSTTLAGYGTVSGTSFAAPYVSGVAGLLFSRFPSLTLQDARLILEYTVDRLLTDKPIGSGRINAYRAVLSDIRPGPFAIIKSPWNDFLLPETGMQEIQGTALGDTYILEYQPEGGAFWTVIGSGGETINGVLGLLNIDALPPDITFHNIRLRSFKGGQTDFHAITVARGGGYQTGWPKQLGGGAILSPASVFDVDGDGDLEIVIGTNLGQVFVLNHDGTVASGWPKTMPSPFVFGAPAIGDIDGDGDPEIVVTTYGGFGIGGHVSAWHHNGAVVSGWPKAVGQMRGAAALADLDADPALEVVAVATGLSGAHGKLLVWNGDGTSPPGWPYTLPESNVQTAPAVGDVDNDGSLDIVISTYGYMVILRQDGSLMSLWSKGGSHTHPILMDIDSDGDLEIGVMEGGNYTVRDHTGTLRWSQSAVSNGYNQGSSGNVISDSLPEIFYAGSSVLLPNAGNVYAWTSNGTALTGWPQTVVGDIGAEPTLGDLDGDSIPEIVLPTESGRVYAWDRNGTLMPGFPKPTGSALYRAVTIVDLDQDGDAELIAGVEDGTLFVWDLPGSYDADAQPWPLSRHDVQNTGALPLPPSNQAPILNPIGPQSLNEGSLLTITVNASDPDGDTLTYSATGLPFGSSFDSATRTFSWTPDYTQSGLYSVTFTVSDGSLTDSETVPITVNNLNRPPVFVTPIGPQTVQEGQTLKFTVASTDPDGVAPILTASNLPPGATFTLIPSIEIYSAAEFEWTPSYDVSTQEVNRIFSPSFTADDVEGLITTMTVPITVVNVNRPPILNPIGPKSVHEGQLLTFIVTGSDPDGDALTYFTGSLPTGASFDPATRIFNWTPGTGQAGNYPITFSVADGSLTASEDVTITVVGWPDLVETTVTNPPRRAKLGRSFSVTDTAQNQGTAASESSTIRYYLSLDTIKGETDKLLTGSRAIPGLAVGATSTGTATVTVPSTTALGTYYLLACTDDTLVVSESSETNNCIASATTVRIKRR
ncbi:MAG: S8 family serine peptidase [Nitrospirae bacterium]|nr:S8 family serine peptidase [Nitrospirota bacterium]